MSRRIKSTYRPKGRGFDCVYPQALIKVGEPQEEPPIETKNVTPDQERKDEGASAFPGGEGASAFPGGEGASAFPGEGPSLEAAQQELAEPKIGSEHGDDPEHGDGPDIEGKELPNPEPMKMLEAGEGKPQV